MKEKKIVGYQVRNKHNDGIRFESFFLTACKENCPPGAAVWSLYSKVYGIKLRISARERYRAHVERTKREGNCRDVEVIEER